MPGFLLSLALLLSWGVLPGAGLAAESGEDAALRQINQAGQSKQAPQTGLHRNLVRRVSLDDVQTTMDRLETLVLEHGLELHGRIHLGADTRKAGVTLADAQLISFGNPNTLGLVMSHDIQAGLELPLKMLVYEADDGNTWVEYREPLSLREQYRLDKCTAMEALSQLMAELAEAAADGEVNGN